jgi:hypothetical protein
MLERRRITALVMRTTFTLLLTLALIGCESDFEKCMNTELPKAIETFSAQTEEFDNIGWHSRELELILVELKDELATWSEYLDLSSKYTGARRSSLFSPCNILDIPLDRNDRSLTQREKDYVECNDNWVVSLDEVEKAHLTAVEATGNKILGLKGYEIIHENIKQQKYSNADSYYASHSNWTTEAFSDWSTNWMKPQRGRVANNRLALFRKEYADYCGEPNCGQPIFNSIWGADSHERVHTPSYIRAVIKFVEETIGWADQFKQTGFLPRARSSASLICNQRGIHE